MDEESEISSGTSGRIEDLIVDLGNDRFMTRHEALNSLKGMLPLHEKAISAELVRWIQLYGKSDAGSSASYVNKAALELFQGMSEKGLEPLINVRIRSKAQWKKMVKVILMVMEFLIQRMKNLEHQIMIQ